MIFESRICDKIYNLNLKNRYYLADIARGEKYLSNGKILYAFTPKKERILVVHENDIYQYLYVQGGSLQIECSCKKGPTCEHIIASLIYLKEQVQFLDYECALDDNSSTLMKLKPCDIVAYIHRLVGKHYFLADELTLDFTVIVDTLIKFLCKAPDVYYKDCFDLLKILIGLLNNKNMKISIERNIIDILYSLKDLESKRLYNGFKTMHYDINLDRLINSFEDYWENGNQNKLLDVINLIEEVSKNTDMEIDFGKLSYIKAKNMYNNGDFNNFYKYSIENTTNIDVKILLFKYLYKIEKYDEILSLYNNEENTELKDLYYQSKAKRVLDTDTAVELFSNYPTFENYVLYSKKELIEFDETIKEIVINKCNTQDKCLIYNYEKDYESLFNVCVSVGLDFTLGYMKDLYENYLDKFIIYVQNEIIKIIREKKIFKEIQPYLQKLNQLDFGKYYVHHLVDYLIENEYLQYFEKFQGEEFLKRMTL